MVKISIALFGLQEWFGGDFLPVIDLVRAADEAGIDQVNVTDHVILGQGTENYPYGKFAAQTNEYPFYEPISVLSALAAVTKNIRLSSGIVIAPLRPAVLLAKQLATLDVLSNGRVDIGLGVGWLQKEYEAAGIPWEGRFTRLEEQARVCKLLWTTSPADYHGTTVDFTGVYCHPRPIQSGGMPIWFGLAPTDRNFARIAEVGDGWLPVEQNPATIREHVARLKSAFVAKGRDPSMLGIRAMAMPHYDNSEGLMNDFSENLSQSAPVSLRDTLTDVPALLDAGVTVIELFPAMFCKRAEDFGAFLDQVVEFKKSYT
jgi:probable F420-dependent oxidoreductase